MNRGMNWNEHCRVKEEPPNEIPAAKRWLNAYLTAMCAAVLGIAIVPYAIAMMSIGIVARLPTSKWRKEES